MCVRDRMCVCVRERERHRMSVYERETEREREINNFLITNRKPSDVHLYTLLLNIPTSGNH